MMQPGVNHNGKRPNNTSDSVTIGHDPAAATGCDGARPVGRGVWQWTAGVLPPFFR
jgi:hypothetical protein